MKKRIILGLILIAALVATTSLLAAERSSSPQPTTSEGAEAAPQRPQGFRPGEGGRPLFQMLDELKKAYEDNDREKMGQLLNDIPEVRDRLRRDTGRPDRGMRPGQGRPMRGGTTPASFESSPVPKTEAEKNILGVLEDMHQNQRRGMMNVPPEDGRLLRLLTEATGAKHVVEIGTSNGYSGIWLCLALRTTGGKLTTHEIDARRASLARENFKRAGVDKMVSLVEGDAHETVRRIKEPIDILFLDADKEGYIDYLNKLLPLVRVGGLIVAHNMSPRQADPRYVEAITTNPDLETIFLHMQGAGVGVTLKKR